MWVGGGGLSREIYMSKSPHNKYKNKNLIIKLKNSVRLWVGRLGIEENH